MVLMEAEIRVMPRYAKEPLGLPEAGRGKEGAFPRSLQREHDPGQHLDFGLLISKTGNKFL